MDARKARIALHTFANPRKAEFLKGFFKTAPGEYGHGDIFLGVMVPQTRQVARQFSTLPLAEIQKLLRSKIHEERLLALMIVVEQYAKADEAGRERVYTFYLRNLHCVNNWDLVDCSAHLVVGPHLENGDRRLLYKLARSKRLWDRRVAVLSTMHYIRQNDFEDILKLAALLLKDKEDLMHKAVGWMLREVGKRDPAVLEKFLKTHCRAMPRTMLRYAIERFPKAKRKFYMCK